MIMIVNIVRFENLLVKYMDKTFLLPFIKKEQLNQDTFTFFFGRNGKEKAFIPGQYYEMTLPHEKMDERGDARVFTISSSPTDREYITITTRIIQSSFKMTLANIKPGDLVNFGGPWDDLNFDETDKSPHVFLSGGIGITPYHSIVNYVIDKRLDNQMILFASWKNRGEMIFDDFFRNVNNHIENFTYVPTLTEERASVPAITDIDSLQDWDGEKGRVSENMLRKYIFDIQNSKYYFSGPPAMIKGLKETVVNMGAPKEKIIAEEFEGY